MHGGVSAGLCFGHDKDIAINAPRKDGGKLIEKQGRKRPVDAQHLTEKTPAWRYQKQRFLGHFLKVGIFGLILRFCKLTVALPPDKQ